MPVLLDTCALIWIANGDPISEPALGRVRDAEARGHDIFVSAITAWEIAMLSAKGRIRLTSSPETWFERAMSAEAMAVQPLCVGVLVQSVNLPGLPPSDPADRMIIATAREHGLTILTRDQGILDYGGAGLVKSMAC